MHNLCTSQGKGTKNKEGRGRKERRLEGDIRRSGGRGQKTEDGEQEEHQDIRNGTRIYTD
jgi:hypothetical protein